MSGWAVKVITKRIGAAGEAGEVVEELWDAYAPSKNNAESLVRAMAQATADERIEAVEELSDATLTELGLTLGQARRRPFDLG